MRQRVHVLVDPVCKTTVEQLGDYRYSITSSGGPNLAWYTCAQHVGIINGYIVMTASVCEHGLHAAVAVRWHPHLLADTALDAVTGVRRAALSGVSVRNG